MPSWLTWERLRDETRTRLWPLPVVALVLAIGLGIGLSILDAALAEELPESLTIYLFGGGAGAARSFLAAIATSLITVTSLTFSLTVLTLQLASSQYSPRLLRTFTRDRFVHRTLALFLGAFVYALTVIRTVRTPEEGQDAFVPQIAVTVAFGLTLASALGLVLFLAHLAREIRVETILRNVHDDASGSIERVLGERDTLSAPELERWLPSEQGRRLLSPASGFVIGVQAEPLREAALEVGAVVLIDRPVGDALVEGTPVARAWSVSGGSLSDDDLDALQERLPGALAIGFERTSQEDVGFGLRQLIDVAIKALSPGINDPTTAVHALNHAAALLCDLLQKDLGAEVLRDDQDRPRVIVQQRSFGELLDLAVAQPRVYGIEDPFVVRAILELLQAVDRSSLDEDHRKELTALARAVDVALR